MAVDEALCNIYRHGYKGDVQGRVTMQIDAVIEPLSRIDIQIQDKTPRTSIETIRSRDLDDIRPGGLGVHLIQSVMDDATWTETAPLGMCVQMHKTMQPLESEQKAERETSHE